MFSQQHLIGHLKTLEEKEEITPMRSRWKEIIKVRAENHNLEIEKQCKGSMKLSVVLGQINKTDKPLVKLTK